MEVDTVQRKPVLVIVACGSAKVWDTHPDLGPTQAAHTYTGTPFKLNRQYAERFGDAWLILSAKYGVIAPDFVIPERYEVTFNRKSSNPITYDRLQEQVNDMRLHSFEVVVGLGGKAYRDAITAAFEGLDVQLVFPFAGLPLGKMLQATRRALDQHDPGIEVGGEDVF